MDEPSELGNLQSVLTTTINELLKALIAIVIGSQHFTKVKTKLVVTEVGVVYAEL